MQFHFCPYCGATLVMQGQYPACPVGHTLPFSNPQVVGVAGVVHKDGRIVLERRAVATGYGLWALPGGMVGGGEVLEEAMAREVLEETGLAVDVGRLLGAQGGLRVCILFYDCMVTGGALQTSGESLEVAWFSPDQIPWDAFAFPRHKDALKRWLTGLP